MVVMIMGGGMDVVNTVFDGSTVVVMDHGGQGAG
jgi:hypothetical protein